MTSACVERFINISKQFSVDSNLKKKHMMNLFEYLSTKIE